MMNLNLTLRGGGRGALLMLALGLGTATGWGAAGDFERYQVILDRKPFGAEAPPAAAATGAVVVSDAESFIKNLKMTAITKNDITGSLCVGLSDTSTKKNYFLTVGDEEDGITLVEADYDHDRALLRKDGDARWISMNGDAGPAAAAPVNRGMPRAVTSMRAVMRGSSSGMPGLTNEQYERTRSLRPMPSPASASMGRGGSSQGGNEKLSNEQIEERLRKYNMELIRAKGEKGLPLPIPLSPEEDAQLVHEGVLEP